MANVNIEIPDELHKQIKLESVKSETTIKELIIKAISEGVNE